MVSFATIGGVWVAHSVITEYLELADAVLVRLNLLLLMVVSFLPFPTRLLAEYIREDRPERVAATIYGITLLFAATMLSVLWRYAVSRRLVHPDSADVELQMITKRLTPGLAGYVALIIVGLFLPLVAVFGYLAIALNVLIPFGLIRRRQPRPRLFACASGWTMTSEAKAPRTGIGRGVYAWAMMQGMTSPISPEGQDRYRCPDRGGPGGQRCQLLIEHATPVHLASIGGTFRAWVDGAETALPPQALSVVRELPAGRALDGKQASAPDSLLHTKPRVEQR